MTNSYWSVGILEKYNCINGIDFRYHAMYLLISFRLEYISVEIIAKTGVLPQS